MKNLTDAELAMIHKHGMLILSWWYQEVGPFLEAITKMHVSQRHGKYLPSPRPTSQQVSVVSNYWQESTKYSFAHQTPNLIPLLKRSAKQQQPTLPYWRASLPSPSPGFILIKDELHQTSHVTTAISFPACSTGTQDSKIKHLLFYQLKWLEGKTFLWYTLSQERWHSQCHSWLNLGLPALGLEKDFSGV